MFWAAAVMSGVLGVEFSFRSLTDSSSFLDREGLRAGARHVNTESYVRSLDAHFLNTWMSRASSDFFGLPVHRISVPYKHF
jgi:hypothetical protein